MTTTASRRLAAALALAFALAAPAQAQVLAPLPGAPFQFASGVNSNIVRLSPDGKVLYVTNQTSHHLTALDVAADGSLSLRGSYGPASQAPYGIAVAPDGAHVYVATLTGVDVFEADGAGGLQLVQSVSAGSPLNGIAYVHQDGGRPFVYVVTNDTWNNEVVTLAVDAAGRLAEVARTATRSRASTSGYASRPRLAFVSGRLFVENEGTVTVLDAAPNGTLAIVPSSPFLSNAAAQLQDSSYGLAVSPDGRDVFLGYFDSVERHTVADDGTLTYAGTYGLGTGTGAPPNSLAVDPTGNYLVVSLRKAGWYAVLEIATMKPVAGSPVKVATGSAGLEFDAAGAILYGGYPNTTGTWVNALAFAQPPLATQSTYYLTVQNRTGDPAGTVTSDVGAIQCAVPIDSGTGCAAAYDPGTRVTLTATPAAGTVFTGWAGACSGTGPCVVTMDAPRLVQANFDAAPSCAVQVTRAGTGTGTVASTPAGLSCGATCSAGFPGGTTVTLTAAADAGSRFAGWSGACSGTDACVLPLVAQDALVTATFDKLVTLTAGTTGPGKGTITGAGLSCATGATAGCTASIPLTSPAQQVTLTATPDGSSFFQYWSGCASTSGASGELCTVSMDRARTVYATFQPSAFALAVRVVGTNAGGTVTGPGIACASGSTSGCSATVPNTTPATQVTLVAAPDASSIFQSWSGCSSVSGTTCTVSMTAAKTATASFAPSTWVLTARTGGTGKGTISGAGIGCASGSTAGCTATVPNTSPATQVTLVAAPDAASLFTGWTGCDSVVDTTCTVSVPYAKTVTATFAPSTFVLTAQATGSGKGAITSADGISCATGSTAGCTATLPNTTPARQVTLVAAPDAGSLFSGWAGCDAVTGTTCTVGMTGARSVTASFAPSGFVLTVGTSGTGKGTITGDGGIACTTGSTAGCSLAVPNTTPATQVTLVAAADASSLFTGWSGCTSAAGNTCTVAVTGSRTVYASFAPSTYTLTARASGSGIGTVTSDVGGISCPTGATSGCTAAIANTTPATVVTLTATPDASSFFQSWSGCTSVSGATCTVSMTAARSATAVFAPRTWLLTVRTGGAGKGTVTAPGTSLACTSGATAGCTEAVANTSPVTRVTLTAAPDASSVFSSWTGCDAASGNTCTVAMSYARSVTANFAPAFYALTVTPSGAGKGSVAGGTISCTTGSPSGCTATVPNTSPATVVTLTATPDAYSSFAFWSGCSTVSGRTCTVTMSGARNVSASFGIAAYPLTVALDGAGSGAVSGGAGAIDCATGGSGPCTMAAPATSPATSVTLTAAPGAGSTFVSWTGCTAASGPTCTVTVSGARTVRARFDLVGVAVYEASTPASCNGETYRFALADPARIAEADANVAAARTVNVDGAVLLGAGVNAPWSWSYDAASVSFPSTVLMVVQPCPGELSQNPSAWAGQHVYQTGRLLRRLQ